MLIELHYVLLLRFWHLSIFPPGTADDTDIYQLFNFSLYNKLLLTIHTAAYIVEAVEAKPSL